MVLMERTGMQEKSHRKNGGRNGLKVIRISLYKIRTKFGISIIILTGYGQGSIFEVRTQYPNHGQPGWYYCKILKS